MEAGLFKLIATQPIAYDPIQKLGRGSPFLSPKVLERILKIRRQMPRVNLALSSH